MYKFDSNIYKTLILSITKRCNLCCLYCKPNSKDSYDKLSFFSDVTDLKKIHFDNILKFCKKNHIKEILLTGGEPLEYPYILELLCFLYESNITFSIHTNGVSSRWDEVLTFLKNKKLYPDIFLSIELSRNLQKELRNTFIPFRLIKKLNKLNSKVELKINLHKKVLKYLPYLEKIFDFWLNKGIYSIRFQPTVPIESSKIFHSISLDASCIKLFEKLIYLKKNKYKSFIRNTVANLYLPISIIKKEIIPNKIISQCYANKKIIIMRTDGTLLNCFQLWNKKNCLDDFNFKCCCFYP